MENYSKNLTQKDLSSLMLIRKPNLIPIKIQFNNFKSENVQWVLVDEICERSPLFTKYFSQQFKILWRKDEIPFSLDDINQFKNLNNNDKTLIKSILLFFRFADKIAIGSLNTLITKIPYRGLITFYASQMLIEEIHDDAYDHAALLYYDNPILLEKDIRLMQNILNEADLNPEEIIDIDNYECEFYQNKSEEDQKIFKAVIKLLNTMNKWKNVNSFQHQFIGLGVSEGLLFKPLFALIETFKSENVGLKYLIDLNNFIIKDEAVHAKTCFEIANNYIVNLIDLEEIKEIIIDIVNANIEFLKIIFSDDMKVNNKSNIEFINMIKKDGNDIFNLFNKGPTLKIFEYDEEVFETINLPTKHNFFERSSTYSNENFPRNISTIINQMNNIQIETNNTLEVFNPNK